MGSSLNQPYDVETLKRNDPEALAVLGQSFASHPMVPPDPKGKPEHWGATLMMSTMLKSFGDAPDARLLGIRLEGRLACVAFVHAYGYEPGPIGMVRMLIPMLRVVGLKQMIDSMKVLGEKHPGDDKRLELLILGTHDDFQKRGLGRAMVRHVLNYAKAQAYAAVLLEAAKDTPAYGFYLREGFVDEKELTLAGETLVYMRREVG